jgi:DNA-binding HxlR family transcriptional regulator
VKSYNRFCPVARALDVLGERWTLLIIRELDIGGPARFTDLQKNLPDLASNLLSERLRDLETRGLVVRETVSPPTPAKVYRLTNAGREVHPILIALGRWGIAHAPVNETAHFEVHMSPLLDEVMGGAS